MAKNTQYFTLSQAAKETGKSKSVISKALKDGTLSYHSKDDSGYKIEPSELFRVFPKNEHKEHKSYRSGTPIELLENDLKNAYKIKELELEVKSKNETIVSRESDIKRLEEQSEDLKIERNKWREQSERLMISHNADLKPVQANETFSTEIVGGKSKDAPKGQILAKTAGIFLIAVGVATSVFIFRDKIEVAGENLGFIAAEAPVEKLVPINPIAELEKELDNLGAIAPAAGGTIKAEGQGIRLEYPAYLDYDNQNYTPIPELPTDLDASNLEKN